MSEGEMGSSFLPSTLLDETNFLFEVKSVMNQAYAKVRKWRKDHPKK
jgi:hypothetical protein